MVVMVFSLGQCTEASGQGSSRPVAGCWGIGAVGVAGPGHEESPPQPRRACGAEVGFSNPCLGVVIPDLVVLILPRKALAIKRVRAYARSSPPWGMLET